MMDESCNLLLCSSPVVQFVIIVFSNRSGGYDDTVPQHSITLSSGGLTMFEGGKGQLLFGSGHQHTYICSIFVSVREGTCLHWKGNPLRALYLVLSTTGITSPAPVSTTDFKPLIQKIPHLLYNGCPGLLRDG